MQLLFVKNNLITFIELPQAVVKGLPVYAFTPNYHSVELVLCKLVLVLIGANITETKEGSEHVSLN